MEEPNSDTSSPGVMPSLQKLAALVTHRGPATGAAVMLARLEYGVLGRQVHITR